ncbi:MAG: DUF1841 family protein [Deltaproteobacteria bacterium]|nr:DUF1841 family protein [Deltaproteobacteria bacterium]
MDFVEFENSVEKLTTYDCGYLRKVWCESLTGEEDILLKQIMSEHPEYYSFFENCVGGDINQAKKEQIFLHLAHHFVVESQLRARDPIEVLQFCNHVRKCKGSHHEAVHFASLLFFEQIVKAETKGGDIDLKAYRSNLWKLKKRPLRKIRMALLA